MQSRRAPNRRVPRTGGHGGLFSPEERDVSGNGRPTSLTGKTISDSDRRVARGRGDLARHALSSTQLSNDSTPVRRDIRHHHVVRCARRRSGCLNDRTEPVSICRLLRTRRYGKTAPHRALEAVDCLGPVASQRNDTLLVIQSTLPIGPRFTGLMRGFVATYRRDSTGHFQPI